MQGQRKHRVRGPGETIVNQRCIELLGAGLLMLLVNDWGVLYQG
jgi:hypothetical protein